MIKRIIDKLKSAGSDGSLLIVRYYALGDIVLSLPLVYALREALPETRIDFLCLDRFREALSGVREIDGTITMEGSLTDRLRTVARLRKKKYDMVIDLLSSPGSATITWLSAAGYKIGMDTGRNNWCYDEVLPRQVTRNGRAVRCYTIDSNLETARLLGVRNEDHLERSSDDDREERYRTGFPASDSERIWADTFYSRIGDKEKGFAGIVPGSKYHSKSWPEASFSELARLISEDLGMIPVVIWGPGEEEVADRLVEADRRIVKPPSTGIARLGALIEKLTVLVGIDSGPKHLAVIQGVPTVTLFGPTDPRTWDPMTRNHIAISKEMDCRPCRDRDCSNNKCMNEIGPEEVVAAIKEVLKAPADRIQPDA